MCFLVGLAVGILAFLFNCMHCWVQVASWAMCFVVGLAVGILAFLFNWAIAALSTLKFSVTSAYITPGGGFVVPFFVFISFSVCFALAAGLCGTYLSPQAAGRWDIRTGRGE